MTDEAKTITERKRNWQQDDVAQITNEKHMFYPAFVTIITGGFHQVFCSLMIIDERAEENNAWRGYIKVADLKYVGVAQVRDSGNRAEKVGLYEGLKK